MHTHTYQLLHMYMYVDPAYFKFWHTCNGNHPVQPETSAQVHRNLGVEWKIAHKAVGYLGYCGTWNIWEFSMNVSPKHSYMYMYIHVHGTVQRFLSIRTNRTYTELEITVIKIIYLWSEHRLLTSEWYGMYMYMYTYMYTYMYMPCTMWTLDSQKNIIIDSTWPHVGL